MANFFPLKVSKIQKETKDCSSVAFEVPDDIKTHFQYNQGQHLTLKTVIDGKEVRRSYSLCSSPVDNEWKVAVKKIPNGLFSTYVNETLAEGDILEVMPPLGKFYIEIDESKAKNYVLFAAGSGITPILSILKTHLVKEPKSKFKLFYLNRTAKSIIFKEEIEALRNKYFGRLEIYYLLTKEQRDIPMLNGRFSAEKLEQLTKTLIQVDAIDDCFICGPEQMIFLIRDELVKAGLEKEKIHYELFFSGGSEDQKNKAAQVTEQKFEGTEVTIIDGGKEFHFVMDDDYDNILDGALAAGADLPYACKGGVCSTCKCAVKLGSVEMKINYALEEEELQKGWVLSCQAVPTSEKVVVDFDV